MPSYYGGVTLSREQTAQVAYAAGARGDDLIFLTAIPQRESSYNAGAHRTDAPRSRLSGDRGLWQINYRWDRELMNAGIIRQPSDLFDPMVNARAAVYVLRKQGRAAWGMGSNGWAAGGDPMKGASWDAAAQAVSRAGAQGLLGQDWQSGPSAASPGQAGGGTTGPVGLPRDARIVQVGGKAPVVVFNLMPGLFIYYTGNFNASGRPVERITQAQWNKKYGGRTPFAGDVEELKSIPSGFGSYKEFWNSIVNQVIGSSNPARNDPEIMRVIAEIAGRPDMSAAEIENRLKATKYYQRRTEGELQWNSLSEAERAAQRK